MRIYHTVGFKLSTEITLLAFYFSLIIIFFPSPAQGMNESLSVIDMGLTGTNSDIVNVIASGGSTGLPGYVSAELGLPAGVFYSGGTPPMFSMCDIVVPGRIPIRLIRTFNCGNLNSHSEWYFNHLPDSHCVRRGARTKTLDLGNGEIIEFTLSGVDISYPPTTESTPYESITGAYGEPS